jgi:hypothetical protein
VRKRLRPVAAALGTGYVEWVLGDSAEITMHVITEVDRGAVPSARNAYNIEFADRIAFFGVDGTSDGGATAPSSWAQRRTEEPALPACASPTGWERLWIPCRDPVSFELADGGTARSLPEGRAGRRGSDALRNWCALSGRPLPALRSRAEMQGGHLSAVQVETPDPS